MLPLNLFKEFISANTLFNGSNKLLLAVSGGKDSVLMAYLFNAAGFQFGIAHCNFRLRGSESDQDEDFTRELATQFNVPFYSISFDTQEAAKKDHISIEMAARDFRYSWFEKIRKDNNYDLIALAHHKNDSAETIILNMVRGTGISGLHGIIPKRDNLVRPLLFLSREEINEIISNENIPFREDSSNGSVKYARNKIRLEIIPRLKELNPGLEETFDQNSRRFAEVEEYFKDQMDLLRKQLFKEQASGDYHIALADLKKLKPQRTLLFELFSRFGFRSNILDDLRQSWNGIPGKIFESPTHTILLDRDLLILHRKTDGFIEDRLVFENEGYTQWGTHNFTLQQAEVSSLKIINNPDQAYLDAARLSFPLKFRSWQQGDIFYPLGMTGKKKLSDFFISKKVPFNSKKLIPVLENGNGDIIWIAGYQVDNRYKVTPESKKVVIFEIQK